jgi:hypothetical protein
MGPQTLGMKSNPTQPQFGGRKTQAAITSVALALATNLHATGAVLPPSLKLPKTIVGPPIESCQELVRAFQNTIVPRLLKEVEGIQGQMKSLSEVNLQVKPTVSAVLCGPATEGVEPTMYPLITVPILKTTPPNACSLIGGNINNTPLRNDIRHLLNRADSLNVSWTFNCSLQNPPPVKINDPTNVVFLNPFSK